jgi:hypothetical protein
MICIYFRGGWVACHALSSDLAPHFQACAIGHPSCHLEQAWGRNPQDLFDTVQAPILLLPANGDPTEYYEDGPWFQSVKSRFPSSKSVVFPTVEHGFIPRGDITKPEMKEAVDQSLDLIAEFLKAHI